MSKPIQVQGGRVPVLMYHRVGSVHSRTEMRYCVGPALFASQMRALAERGMSVCAIDDFVAWLEGGIELVPGAFLLTFDDGFLGIYEHAFPVLQELGWTATVFLVSALLGGKDVWQHPDSGAGRNYPLLGLAEIDAMRQSGIAFHSHTRTHADLTRLSDDALTEEVAGSRLELERLLGERVSYLAYPYGRFDERVSGVARTAGYRAAFSVHSGFNRPRMDAYCIRRLDVFGSDTTTQLLRKVSLGTNDGSWSQSLRYYVGQLSIRLGTSTRSD